MAMAVACVGMAAEKVFGGNLVFRPSTGWNTPGSLVGVIIVKFTHALARVLKKSRSLGGKEGDFWNGHCRSVCRLASRC
jgi:hypothetical protein